MAVAIETMIRSDPATNRAHIPRGDGSPRPGLRRRRLAAGRWLSARGLRRDRRIGDLAGGPGGPADGCGATGPSGDVVTRCLAACSAVLARSPSIAASRAASRSARAGVSASTVSSTTGSGSGAGRSEASAGRSGSGGPLGGLVGRVGLGCVLAAIGRLGGAPLLARPRRRRGARCRLGRRAVAFARPAIGVGRRPGLPLVRLVRSVRTLSPVHGGQPPAPSGAASAARAFGSSWTKLTIERR